MKTFAFAAAVLAGVCLCQPAQAFHGFFGVSRSRVVIRQPIVRQRVVVQQQVVAAPIVTPAFVAPVVSVQAVQQLQYVPQQQVQLGAVQGCAGCSLFFVR